MKNTFLSIGFVFLLLTSGFAQTADLKYTVNLNESADDLFRVTLDVSGLGDANDIYQFASTAPGTYQQMDIGRFVREFKAYDKKGREIATEKISVNQYRLSKPKKIRKIVYQLAETWDTPVEKHRIYKMGGTSIEKDHVLINGHCVFGYPKGMQDKPIEVKLLYPDTWKAGTALKKNSEGNYYAEDYDMIVDSPILLGRLSTASTTLSGVPIELYTYSKTDLIKSEDLLTSMQDMLKAAEAFVVKLPVDHYTFLFHFEDEPAGAWEHSYSSEYVMAEQPFTPEYGQQITDIAAHEFFHVITPLNIHSEIIEQFNFVTPTASEHLWLYEGVTEWASHIMQLRYGLTTLDDFFAEWQQKLLIDSRYDPSYSLSKLSLTSFSDEGQQQYGNIYMRGALVAGLLDIRLLELSKGTKGLREVILDLSKKYGPDQAFPEKDFFDVFTAMTYPEIKDFFTMYVKEANPLPMAEYFGKLGIRYTPEISTGERVSTLGISLGAPDGKIRIVDMRVELKEMGLMVNDELAAVNGTALTFQNARELLTNLNSQPIDTEYSMTVRRGDEEKTIMCKVLSKDEVKMHVFEVDPDATNEQTSLRKAWMKNLEY